MSNEPEETEENVFKRLGVKSMNDAFNLYNPAALPFLTAVFKDDFIQLWNHEDMKEAERWARNYPQLGTLDDVRNNLKWYMELEADDKVPQDDKIQVRSLTRLRSSGEYVKSVYNTLPQTKRAVPWLSDDALQSSYVSYDNVVEPMVGWILNQNDEYLKASIRKILKLSEGETSKVDLQEFRTQLAEYIRSGKPIPPLNLVTQVESGKGATGGNTVVLLELLMVSLGLLIVSAVIVRAYRIKTPESKGYVRKEVFLSAVVGLVTGVFYILIILSTLGILRSSSSSSRLRLTKRLGRLGRVGEEFMVGYIQYHRVYLGLWLFVLSAMGVSIDSVVVSVVVSSIGLVVGVVYLLWITVRFLKRKKKNSP
jgi:hypothetical protein